jgi:hypothetical protein
MSLLNRKMNGRTKNPYQDPTSIGNLAIQKGYATPEQVAFAVQKQEERLPLGKILIEQGVLTEIQLDELLVEQEIKRRKLNSRQASKLWAALRHSKMREVTKGLREVTTSLASFAKS